MNCIDILTLAPLYLTGELDASQMTSFCLHLQSCARCALEIERQKMLDFQMKESIDSEIHDTTGLDRRVLDRIAASSSVPRVPLWRWAVAIAGIAVILLVGLGGYRALHTQRVQESYAAAALDHRIEIVERQPRKWRSGPLSIEELAVQEGLPASALAAVAPSGYHLEQGRLCRLNGAIFLHLVYRNGTRNFSLFLRRDQSATSGSRDIQTAKLGAQHIAGFVNAGIHALIVTDQTGDAAVRFARQAATVL